MIPTTTAHDAAYRSDLAAALSRLDSLRERATECEACARRAMRHERRRAALAGFGRSIAAGVLGLFLAFGSICALVGGLLAAMLFVIDAGGAAKPTCADFGCSMFVPQTENIPHELAACTIALGAFWLAVWGIERCWVYARRSTQQL